MIDSSVPISEMSGCCKTCYLSKHVLCFLIDKVHPTVWNSDGIIFEESPRPWKGRFDVAHNFDPVNSKERAGNLEVEK